MSEDRISSSDYGPTLVPPIQMVAAKTALLVIDMQYHDAASGYGYSSLLERTEPGSGQYFDERIEDTVVPAIQQLASECRRLGVLVVYLRFGSFHRDYRDLSPRMREFIRRIEQASGIEDFAWSESPLHEIRRELTPQPSDLVIDKTTWGAYSGSNLDTELKERNIETVVATGVSTNTCVETTAREAADRGYGSIIVDECSADYDHASHRAALSGFHSNFGYVVPTASAMIEAIAVGARLGE